MGTLYVIPANQKAGRHRRTVQTREEWIAAIAEVGFNPKPPNYWMERKRSEGDAEEGKGYSDAALGKIWFTRYQLGRRAMIWMEAPERDWIDAGYLVNDGWPEL